MDFRVGYLISAAAVEAAAEKRDGKLKLYRLAKDGEKCGEANKAKFMARDDASSTCFYAFRCRYGWIKYKKDDATAARCPSSRLISERKRNCCPRKIANGSRIFDKASELKVRFFCNRVDVFVFSFRIRTKWISLGSFAITPGHSNTKLGLKYTIHRYVQRDTRSLRASAGFRDNSHARLRYNFLEDN